MTSRMLKELRSLAPWQWDSKVDSHPAGPASLRDFEKIEQAFVNPGSGKTRQQELNHKMALGTPGIKSTPVSYSDSGSAGTTKQHGTPARASRAKGRTRAEASGRKGQAQSTPQSEGSVGGSGTCTAFKMEESSSTGPSTRPGYPPLQRKFLCSPDERPPRPQFETPRDAPRLRPAMLPTPQDLMTPAAAGMQSAEAAVSEPAPGSASDATTTFANSAHVGASSAPEEAATCKALEASLLSPTAVLQPPFAATLATLPAPLALLPAVLACPPSTSAGRSKRPANGSASAAPRKRAAPQPPECLVENPSQLAQQDQPGAMPVSAVRSARQSAEIRAQHSTALLASAEAGHLSRPQRVASQCRAGQLDLSPAGAFQEPGVSSSTGVRPSVVSPNSPDQVHGGPALLPQNRSAAVSHCVRPAPAQPASHIQSASTAAGQPTQLSVVRATSSSGTEAGGSQLSSNPLLDQVPVAALGATNTAAPHVPPDAAAPPAASIGSTAPPASTDMPPHAPAAAAAPPQQGLASPAAPQATPSEPGEVTATGARGRTKPLPSLLPSAAGQMAVQAPPSSREAAVGSEAPVALGSQAPVAVASLAALSATITGRQVQPSAASGLLGSVPPVPCSSQAGCRGGAEASAASASAITQSRVLASVVPNAAPAGVAQVGLFVAAAAPGEALLALEKEEVAAVAPPAVTGIRQLSVSTPAPELLSHPITSTSAPVGVAPTGASRAVRVAGAAVTCSPEARQAAPAVSQWATTPSPGRPAAQLASTPLSAAQQPATTTSSATPALPPSPSLGLQVQQQRGMSPRLAARRTSPPTDSVVQQPSTAKCVSAAQSSSTGAELLQLPLPVSPASSQRLTADQLRNQLAHQMVQHVDGLVQQQQQDLHQGQRHLLEQLQQQHQQLQQQQQQRGGGSLPQCSSAGLLALPVLGASAAHCLGKSSAIRRDVAGPSSSISQLPIAPLDLRPSSSPSGEELLSNFPVHPALSAVYHSLCNSHAVLWELCRPGGGLVVPAPATPSTAASGPHQAQLHQPHHQPQLRHQHTHHLLVLQRCSQPSQHGAPSPFPGLGPPNVAYADSGSTGGAVPWAPDAVPVAGASGSAGTAPGPSQPAAPAYGVEVLQLKLLQHLQQEQQLRQYRAAVEAIAAVAAGSQAAPAGGTRKRHDSPPALIHQRYQEQQQCQGQGQQPVGASGQQQHQWQDPQQQPVAALGQQQLQEQQQPVLAPGQRQRPVVAPGQQQQSPPSCGVGPRLKFSTLPPACHSLSPANPLLGEKQLLAATAEVPARAGAAETQAEKAAPAVTPPTRTSARVAALASAVPVKTLPGQVAAPASAAGNAACDAGSLAAARSVKPAPHAVPVPAAIAPCRPAPAVAQVPATADQAPVLPPAASTPAKATTAGKSAPAPCPLKTGMAVAAGAAAGMGAALGVGAAATAPGTPAPQATSSSSATLPPGTPAPAASFDTPSPAAMLGETLSTPCAKGQPQQLRDAASTSPASPTSSFPGFQPVLPIAPQPGALGDASTLSTHTRASAATRSPESPVGLDVLFGERRRTATVARSRECAGTGAGRGAVAGPAAEAVAASPPPWEAEAPAVVSPQPNGKRARLLFGDSELDGWSAADGFAAAAAEAVGCDASSQLALPDRAAGELPLVSLALAPSLGDNWLPGVSDSPSTSTARGAVSRHSKHLSSPQGPAALSSCKPTSPSVHRIMGSLTFEERQQQQHSALVARPVGLLPPSGRALQRACRQKENMVPPKAPLRSYGQCQPTPTQAFSDTASAAGDTAASITASAAASGGAAAPVSAVLAKRLPRRANTPSSEGDSGNAGGGAELASTLDPQCRYHWKKSRLMTA